MKDLIATKLGHFATICGFADSTPIKIKRRLLDLGFTKGQKIKVVRKSTLGKDYMVELRYFTLTLRGDILRYILVEEGEK